MIVGTPEATVGLGLGILGPYLDILVATCTSEEHAIPCHTLLCCIPSPKPYVVAHGPVMQALWISHKSTARQLGATNFQLPNIGKARCPWVKGNGGVEKYGCVALSVKTR